MRVFLIAAVVFFVWATAEVLYFNGSALVAPQQIVSALGG